MKAKVFATKPWYVSLFSNKINGSIVKSTPGLTLHGGNNCNSLHAPGHCLGALEMLSQFLQFGALYRGKKPWCPCPFKTEAYRPDLLNVKWLAHNMHYALWTYGLKEFP